MKADRRRGQRGHGEVGRDLLAAGVEHAHPTSDRANRGAEHQGGLYPALIVGHRGVGVHGRALELDPDAGVSDRPSRLIRHACDERLGQRLPDAAALALPFENYDPRGLTLDR